VSPLGTPLENTLRAWGTSWEHTKNMVGTSPSLLPSLGRRMSPAECMLSHLISLAACRFYAQNWLSPFLA